jgi:hypothetical protein
MKLMPGVDDNRDQWFEHLRQHSAESDRSWSTAFCLSLFLGWLGVDRLYLGSAWLGLFKLFTCGGLFIWWFIDIVLLLAGAMRDGEGRTVKRRKC